MQNLFIFGDSIPAISQSSDRVQVEFTNNSPRKFALVCDGPGCLDRFRGGIS